MQAFACGTSTDFGYNIQAGGIWLVGLYCSRFQESEHLILSIFGVKGETVVSGS